MKWEDNLFGDTRKQAFSLWGKSTNRDCHLVNDDITASFECKWQDRATLCLGYEHISIFCSLGEWANNISDILREETYDNYNFLYEEHSKALFRYYTRLLLVISEILTDFENILQELENPDSQKIREFLSAKKGEINSIFAFINNICKHKTSSLHRCNHHLPIWFEDCKEPHPFKNPISISNLDFDHPDGILIPKIDYFVGVIIQCYTRLDGFFEKNDDKFKAICDLYDGVSFD
jgi:hypothetical protein